MTRRKGGDTTEPSEQVFVRYKSIFDARRGIGRVYGRYNEIEIPELRRWKIDTDWLLRTSWTLHRATKEQEEQFVWQAERRIREHERDKSEIKIDALKRFVKISTLTDSLGRRNTTMIPLVCCAVDRSLEARTQQVRGIGRRMDWRAVVLEYVIDQLQTECRSIRRATQEALQASDIFGQNRTPKSLRIRANRISDYIRFLKTVQVRTFTRVFNHVVSELEEAAELLHDTADKRNTQHLERVRLLFGKIYRSMILLEQHWRLEEVLIVVSSHVHNVEVLSADQIRLFTEELDEVHRTLTNQDPVTGVHIDTDFETDVLPTVVGSVLSCLTNLRGEGGVFLPSLYNDLKTACKPL
ncbi:hypothetical protein HYV69_03510 [Candidatus Uhrbacteria bacterium]|nr:hypothetical protein [Candidatus Uhrbacteria bacterium]